MTIYVDPLTDWGMKYRGKPVKTCHMVSDGSLKELHQAAVKLGLRRYFQDDPRHPHYDLMASRREIAVKTLGAKEISTRELLEVAHSVKWVDGE